MYLLCVHVCLNAATCVHVCLNAATRVHVCIVLHVCLNAAMYVWMSEINLRGLALSFCHVDS